MKVIRTAGVGTMFFLGVAGSIATGPVADLSGVSDDVRLTLDADTPSERITAVATVDVDAVIASGTGQIGLSVTLDNDAEGSLSFTLTSGTTGSTQGTDIVDTQAQGTARVGIDAFEGCGPGPCDEELVLEFNRTDVALDGVLGLTFSLDGLASTETEAPEQGSGSITFSIDR
jgi:hypothetical protein